MHERSLVKTLLLRVTELAAGHGPGRVTLIDVEVGEFAGVEVDLLASAFAAEVADLPAWRDTALRIHRVELQARCPLCGLVRLRQQQFNCPGCGSVDITLVGGDDVRLLSFNLLPASGPLS